MCQENSELRDKRAKDEKFLAILEASNIMVEARKSTEEAIRLAKGVQKQLVSFLGTANAVLEKAEETRDRLAVAEDLQLGEERAHHRA